MKELLSHWSDRLKDSGIHRYNRLIIFIALFIAVFLVVSFSVVPRGISFLHLGSPSPETVYAPRNVVDPYTTEKLRKEAAQKVPEVFDYDLTVMEEVTGKIDSFFEQAAEISSSELSAEEKVEELEKISGFILPSASVTAKFLQLNQETAEEIKGRTIQVVEEILQQGVKSEGVDTAKRQVLQGINLLPYQPEIRQVLEQVVPPLIRANMLFNPEATNTNRRIARDAVEPVQIQRNTLIVLEGETVTEAHLAQLEALGLTTESIPYSYYFGIFILVLVILIAGAVYLFNFDKEIYLSFRKLLVLALLLVVTLLMALVTTFYNPYMTPMAMGPMIVTFLFNPHLAVVYAVLQSVLLGFTTGEQFALTLVSIISSLAGIYVIYHMKERNQLYKVTGVLMITSTLVYISMLLAQQGWGLEYELLQQIGTGALAVVLSSLLSTVFTMGILSFLESISGVVTIFTLMELAQPNRPLLRRLMQEAPGTYHHSLMVGNLAEAAAEEIGANGTLVRTAAFYHDIGKLAYPIFFYENQVNVKNPHRNLKPGLSRLVIANHIKYGLKLAKEYNLPKEITDIIVQHHGRSQISFLYRQAMQDNPQDYADMEDDFRYPGPYPQTREAGILLLADSVEAVSRVSANVSLKEMIDKVFEEKEEQLIECPLTLRDLGKIKAAFGQVLFGRDHQRLKYPELDVEEDGKAEDEVID